MLILAAAAAGWVSGAAVPATHPKLSFRPLPLAGHHMDSIVWTGGQFLYVENTTNVVWAAPPAGKPLHEFASMPNLVEETRCLLSPGTHGFAPGVIFCHSPDNKIYELSADGGTVHVLATLPAPYPPASDGALAFDDVGRFGYRLVAATGRSGAGQQPGGVVYTIDPSGNVQQVGTYDGPGGADELAIAPAGFGSAAGDALLTADAGTSGALLAMDAAGQTRTIATFADDGASTLQPIPTAAAGTAAGAAPGLYVTNDINQFVYFAPASQLQRFAGDVLVATEVKAHIYAVEPRGQGFVTVKFRHNLRGGNYSLEGSTYVG